MVKLTDSGLFDLGSLVATRPVSYLREKNPAFDDFVIRSIYRFSVGDWGECSENDALSNTEAIATGGRLIGVYESPDLPRILIITEADRSMTTVLFPEDY